MRGTKQGPSGSPPARALAGALLVLLVLLLPPGSDAASLNGASNTYLQSRESVNGSDLLPIYEYLDLTVQDLKAESVSVHVGGWLGYDILDDSFGDDKKKGSDLQYGYVSYRAKDRNTVLNLGRVMVFDGVVAARVDGAYARTDLPKGFGISVFGGAPVETNINLPGDNMIYGGRISHQYDNLYVIGASYVNEDKNSDIYRREGGLDLAVRPLSKVEIAGRSSFNFQTTGWMEHSYFLMLGPYDKLRFNLETTWISYADYFETTTSSAFTLKPGGALDPNEKVEILGPALFYFVNKNWSLSADYKQYDYHIAGDANSFGISAAYSKPKAYSAGLSLRNMDGDTDRLRYDEYRVYASKKLNKFDVTADIVGVKYAAAINGVSTAYSAALAAGYELSQKLKVGGDVEYGKNPDFDKEVRLLVKLTYHFDVAKGSAAATTSKPAPETAQPAPASAPEPKSEPVPAPPTGDPGKTKEGT